MLTSCWQISQGHSAGLDIKGYTRKYVRVFRMISSTMLDTPLTLIEEAQLNGVLPFIFSAYVDVDGAFDTGARLVSYEPHRESPFSWLLTCNYSSQLDELFSRNTPEMARDAAAGNNTQFEDPFAQPPSIKWGGEQFQRVRFQSQILAQGFALSIADYDQQYTLATPDGYTPTMDDVGLGVMMLASDGNYHGPFVITGAAAGRWTLAPAPPASGTWGNWTGAWTLGGDPIVNSALGRFDPPPEFDDSRLTLTIARNELYVDPATLQLYKDAVNADYFWGAPPGTVHLKPIDADGAYRNGIYFYATTYSLHFREEKWLATVLDQGFRAFKTGTWGANGPQDWTDILDGRSGQPVTSPQLFDGTGHPLNPPGGSSPASPFYRKFSGLRRVPFAPLMLPFNVPQH